MQATISEGSKRFRTPSIRIWHIKIFSSPPPSSRAILALIWGMCWSLMKSSLKRTLVRRSTESIPNVISEDLIFVLRTSILDEISQFWRSFFR